MQTGNGNICPYCHHAQSQCACQRFNSMGIQHVCTYLGHVDGEKYRALEKERDALRAALEYGLTMMIPEIHAQVTCWPGEVDEFEVMACKALGKD